MQATEAIERLQHVSPNTPSNTEHFSDNRFLLMWCPFHGHEKVGLLVYITDWGDAWFNCTRGCWQVQQRIEGLFVKPEPNVISYVTSDASTIVYEARWSL